METIKKKDKSVVQIYLTQKQKQQLKQLAAKEGMTMTGYVVDIIRQNSK
jgi:predicted DNA binding CopG/RHH family protein